MPARLILSALLVRCSWPARCGRCYWPTRAYASLCDHFGTPQPGGNSMKVFEIQGGFGIDNLKLAERPEPRPGPGQVLLKLRAWSLNFRDLLVIKGLYNPKLRLPFVPFSDGVGEVAAVGDGVTRFKVGERLAG